ncbi:conserved hypothetical protein [Candidatus Brocadia pituitae]|nr:conserved hypothetical protein [Candidatus Brocadia pituitae]
MAEQFTISGQIRYSDDRPASRVTVQAFDKDLPSLERRAGVGSQELGSAVTDREGRFTISFTDEQFRRGEASAAAFRRRARHGPDLTFRIVDQQGQELAIRRLTADDRAVAPPRILFNAATETRILIIVEQGDERPESEYEYLLAQITPTLGDLPFAELTDEDLAFLVGELQFDEEQTVWLRWLHAATTLAERTGIVAEAFYGWARTGLPDSWAELRTPRDEERRTAVLTRVLDELVASPEETLIAYLLRAIDERIIPTRIRERASAIARAIRQRGQQEYNLHVQLEHAATGEPLVGYTVTTIDVEGNNRDLGTEVTDPLGKFVVVYFAGNDARAGERNLLFRVRGPDSAEAIEVTERVRPDATGPSRVRVPLPNAPPTLRQLRGNGHIEVPDAVLDTLEREHEIRSLADIRRRGGLSRIAAVRALDVSVTRRLDALADLDRLSSDVDETVALLKYNYDSVAAIAEVSRREFVASLRIGEARFNERRAAELHVAATAQTGMLEQMFAGIMVDFANGNRPSIDFIDGDYIPPFPPKEKKYG